MCEVDEYQRAGRGLSGWVAVACRSRNLGGLAGSVGGSIDRGTSKEILRRYRLASSGRGAESTPISRGCDGNPLADPAKSDDLLNLCQVATPPCRWRRLR